MSKKSKVRGLNEPLRHQDHPRPRTRREFLGTGILDRGGARLSHRRWLGMLAYPRAARATLASDIQNAVAACNITTGAGKIPFICFDLAGGGNIAGSNVLVGGPGGQLDFLIGGGLQQAGSAGLHGAQRERHGELRRFELRLALSRGQRASARHEAARQRSGHGGHDRHDHSGVVAERYQHQSAQSHVRHLSVRRARRAAQSDRLEQFLVRRQLDGAADHGYPGRATDRGAKLPRQQRPRQHGSAQHPAAERGRRDQCAGVHEAHQRQQVRGGAGVSRQRPP